MRKTKLALIGLMSYLPLMNRYFNKRGGNTSSARYCYSVWLRHLVLARQNLHLDGCPKIIAELGPGYSLGTGLAALISGCDQYYAFDVVNYANLGTNLSIFDELVDLFNKREDIPGQDEFPEIRPTLSNYVFPHNILSSEHMSHALEEFRISRIRNSINKPSAAGSVITYKAPWHDSNVIEKQSVDMIYSQAVLEHVADLTSAYYAMKSWLKPTGFISNQIDFRCHGTADEWNGHWAISDFMWRLIRGSTPSLLNREPHSKHIDILAKLGFRVISDIVEKSPSTLTRADLAPRFRMIKVGDLTTSGAFIQATLVT